jgi:xanthine dehydrogenase/oxidase
MSGACDRIISGEVQVGGQEHFYMEPQGTLVWPVDSGNEIHMVSSTQVCSVPLSYKFTVLDIGLIVFQYLDSFFLDQ